MLQVRLWLTVVVIVLAGGLVLLLGTSALHERVMLPFEQVSTNAVNALAGTLTGRASDAVDAAAKATVDPAVLAAAKKGEMTPEADAALLARAGNQGAPAFALLVKPDGTVAARAGSEVKLEGSLAGLPVFAESVTGIARDGVHFIEGKPFHLAAAPVYEGASPAAVVILGWPYDAALADRLAQQAGAGVIIQTKDGRIGTGLADITDEQLNSRGAGVGELSGVPGPFPIFLPDRGRYVLGSVPVLGGGEALTAIVAIDRNEAFTAIATAQVAVLVGTFLIALLQITLIMTTLRAVNRPINVIVDHLSQVSQGNSVGILPEAELTGQFLRLGKQVNMILQMMPSAGRPGGAPLGALGGSAGLGGNLGGNLGAPAFSPPPAPTPDFEPAFGKGGGSGPTPATPAGPGSLGDFNLAPNPGTGAGAAVSEPPSGLSSLFDDNAPDPLAAFRVQQKPPSSPPAAVPAQMAPSPATNGHGQQMPSIPEGSPVAAMSPEATVMFQVPQELLNQSAQVKAAPGPEMPKQADDARTVVASVPAELLSAAAPRADGVTNADEAHYKEVYDRFVQTRVECGEDTSDLTYDRFVAKLMKNRQQIVEKHKAKSVRFQVYVKEGKAALRALPVRD